MKNKNYKERNWLAGFIDGEGCIEIHRHRKKYNNKYYFVQFPRVIIANCNKETMKYIHKLMDYKGSFYSQEQKINWKILYRLSFVKQNAIQLIRLIYPYLKIKKEQAKICLLWNKTIKNRKPFAKTHMRIKKKRNDLYDKCRKLNKRGR